MLGAAFLSRGWSAVRRRTAGALLAIALSGAAAGCGPSSSTTSGASGASSAVTTNATATSTTGPATGSSSAATGRTGTATGRTGTATGSPPPGTPTTTPATGTSALRAAVILIDPGHNGGNGAHPDRINKKVFIGNGYKACNTTGTETNVGYPEHAFTWDLATRLAGILRAAGAQVVLTRPNDAGVGPCISERAAAGNRAHAALTISLHADGAAATGFGFHVIEPGPIGRNDAIVAPSRRLGTAIRNAFRAGTGEPYANYIAHNGIDVRTDLGGLNLSTVPAVFIECGNMRNAADAARLTSPAWRQRAAEALAAGMAGYLSAR
jgi:N-acetylmuramoyl-L-alanine amidase